ncbi:cytochrome-c peroxidase [candidate division KSB1 bacterium]|nr:cytochrome-c peroxidase [candidate division KSB1 bacterium]
MESIEKNLARFLMALLWLSLTFAGMAMNGEPGKKDPATVPELAPLPLPPIPADNLQTHEKVELGKLLFFDPRLGGGVSIACSDCHRPSLGWQDGSDICRGYTGTSHWRNCQTVINAAYLDKLFWAGAARSLEDQAKSAAKGGVAGNGEDDLMEERLRQIPEYIRRFKEVFGTERPEIMDAWRAISAFERTLVQRDTPFDQYMQGDKSAMSEDAIKGMELFKGKANCIQCHNGPMLTDQKYYNLGVPVNPVFEEDALKQITFRYEHYAKGVPEGIYRKTKIDLGLYYRSKRKEDMGKFRTPSLRYLVYTPPYMHNGVFFVLEEVIAFYDQGGDVDQVEKSFGHATKTELLKPLGLTADEKQQLVAFLEGLSGEEIIINIPELPSYGVDRGDGLKVEKLQ